MIYIKSKNGPTSNRSFWPPPIYRDINFVLKCLPAQCDISYLITSSEGIFLQIKVGEGTQVEKFQTFPFMFVEAEKSVPFRFQRGMDLCKRRL